MTLRRLSRKGPEKASHLLSPRSTADGATSGGRGTSAAVVASDSEAYIHQYFICRDIQMIQQSIPKAFLKIWWKTLGNAGI